jgi:hypothetical protein
MKICHRACFTEKQTIHQLRSFIYRVGGLEAVNLLLLSCNVMVGTFMMIRATTKIVVCQSEVLKCLNTMLWGHYLVGRTRRPGKSLRIIFFQASCRDPVEVGIPKVFSFQDFRSGVLLFLISAMSLSIRGYSYFNLRTSWTRPMPTYFLVSLLTFEIIHGRRFVRDEFFFINVCQPSPRPIRTRT